jgi:hypothetical protein
MTTFHLGTWLGRAALLAGTAGILLGCVACGPAGEFSTDPSADPSVLPAVSAPGLLHRPG